MGRRFLFGTSNFVAFDQLELYQLKGSTMVTVDTQASTFVERSTTNEYVSTGSDTFSASESTSYQYSSTSEKTSEEMSTGTSKDASVHTSTDFESKTTDESSSASETMSVSSIYSTPAGSTSETSSGGLSTDETTGTTIDKTSSYSPESSTGSTETEFTSTSEEPSTETTTYATISGHSTASTVEMFETTSGERQTTDEQSLTSGSKASTSIHQTSTTTSTASAELTTSEDSAGQEVKVFSCTFDGTTCDVKSKANGSAPNYSILLQTSQSVGSYRITDVTSISERLILLNIQLKVVGLKHCLLKAPQPRMANTARSRSRTLASSTFTAETFRQNAKPKTESFPNAQMADSIMPKQGLVTTHLWSSFSFQPSVFLNLAKTWRGSTS